MSTTTTTITVTRHERDVLRRELDLLEGTLEDIATDVKRGERHADMLGRVRDGLHLLDDLGWQHDDPRQFYDVTLEHRRLAAWLDWQADQAARCVDDQHATPEEILHSARMYVAHGVTATVAELVGEFAELSRRAVDESLDLLSVARAIRVRLEERD